MLLNFLMSLYSVSMAGWVFFPLGTLTCTELTLCDGQLEPFGN